jgi:hypothetical protein
VQGFAGRVNAISWINDSQPDASLIDIGLFAVEGRPVAGLGSRLRKSGVH